MPYQVVGGELEAIALFCVIAVLGAVTLLLAKCGFMASGEKGSSGHAHAHACASSSASPSSAAAAAAPAPHKPLAPLAPRDFTSAELAPFTGVGGERRILVAVNGIVFDMSSHESGPAFYGPGGSYAKFAGRDATICLATMIVDPAQLGPRALDNLSASETETMLGWARRFRDKYAIAGALTDGAKPTTLAELRAEGIVPPA